MTKPTPKTARRYPVGAEVVAGGGVDFRVWAPDHRRVEVVLEERQPAVEGEGASAIELRAEADGYFSGLVIDAGPGTLYRFRLDGEGPFPDPAARSQPDGPHGPSQVIDPAGFPWGDDDWRGATLRGQVIYEMHVGTFTPGGTWAAAARELPELAALGISLIELMPVADFAGRFGWGYDGVDLFAPTRLYGEPDDFRRFVDRAHQLGIGVILDVVYNHFGPDGCYLTQFTKSYFTDKYANEWGEPVNFDGDDAGPVREFILSNAAYWIEEYHLDGLRLDATQQIFDASSDNILAAIAGRVRESARGRATVIVAENEPQRTQLVRAPEDGGFGLDGLWNDDFHHSATVAATGRSEAYYTDYTGGAQELVSAVKWGFLYQGQRYTWQRRRRGTPTFGLGREVFVDFLQNHDQVANSGRGERLHKLTSPAKYRALTGLLLLGPGTPMLFQGQEFGASAPFYYFADHQGDLAKAVRKGRGKFLAQFRTLATPEMQTLLTDPSDPATFERSKLDLTERDTHAAEYALHRDLIALRRGDPVLSQQGKAGYDGATLSPHAFLIRWFSSDGEDRVLIVNLGGDLHYQPASEPLIAPPVESHWELLWSSEDPRYGGIGTPPLETRQGWFIPGESTLAFRAAPGEAPDRAANYPEMPHD
jgi:maltooligosyltrehalose trehalohydrolase